ncbi:FadR/GntR family transcriptional regulator [Rhizobium sp. SSA_523]|uniref:FadR/GntR family transcriptional regulator n=1 Tax=Rhizobium sp. SSA_523 TaxID=2952477 RepID=UPI002091AD04|nr:FadR/GntR family transcriptional regulator [Rhizobium sp. SSA_523]MCO5732282.1 FadR family transcriptional regulator [Rhizobium sp. SSA_523]WKC21315.1 FadR/GntR family transcriptional regulator [Rhizobium sp. SSA_523]
MIEPGSLLRSLTERTAARNFQSRVIHEIGAGVVSGRFAIGGTLPNDAALMDEFGVSRTVLREALKTLEAKGLLEARPKVGTKVAKKSRWNIYDPQVLAWHLTAPPDRDFLTGLGEVRRSLEPLGAAHAAHRRSSEQVRLMRYWVQQMETSLDQASAFSLADFELHRLVAEASRNPFIRGLNGVIELSHAFAYLKPVNHPDEADLRPALLLHRALVTAIEQGDEQAAQQAMLDVIAYEQVL